MADTMLTSGSVTFNQAEEGVMAGSDYDGWFCTELQTECPDCGAGITEPSGDLDKFLDLISGHLAECPA